MYSIGKFAKLIGRSIQTLRSWDKQGKLIPACRQRKIRRRIDKF